MTVARLLLIALLSSALLAACGKKSLPEPPSGEEERFTYPQFYPAQPGARTGLPAAPSPESEPPPAKLSPYPYNYTSPTKTYESE